ncbi:protein OSB1, mitochondrial-like [Telopea speciosissima]|uniref:protein OSB1, mitochondrial-like n=1 Tax=Telopea speciosissima TaxID=54955 RepID=UPI001CC6798A|nr:protein OSB1, mitochondrial-like [Telopea speciosissima]
MEVLKQASVVRGRSFLCAPQRSPLPLIKTPLSSPSPFPNPFSSLHFSTSLRTRNNPISLRCSLDHNNDSHNGVVYPRPTEIPWKKELCNTVQLIGIVAAPVEIRHFNSGKVLAWTRIGVKKSTSDTSWVSVTFWDELALVAFQHVEKGQRIYVSGRLISDTVEADDGKRQTYYKVVVQQLNFVENSLSQGLSFEGDANSTRTDGKLGNYVHNDVNSTQELWQAFFANPMDWWDNRKNKRNPKYPDFKHKHTGEALWVEAKYNPPWLKSQLAILDSRMEAFQNYEANKPAAFVAGDDFTPF